MIEQALRAAMGPITKEPCPPRLAKALDHAVFSRGSRIRPQLSLAVFETCCRQRGATAWRPEARSTALAAAIAIELLHCASLVHDDLPAFDNAGMRRGLPTVHVAFGEPIAVLVGDALIIRALEVVGETAAQGGYRAVEALLELTRAVGAPSGLCAGQAWESENDCDLMTYHHAKTGALFVAACTIAAKAADADEDQWRAFGARIGEAYQVADDLKDCLLSEHELGKPADQDALNGRPSVAHHLGINGARRRLESILIDAHAIVGNAPEAAPVHAFIAALTDRLASVVGPQQGSPHTIRNPAKTPASHARAAAPAAAE